MPIRPENKHRYPADWKDIRYEVLERAKHCCEFCGVKNHAIGYRSEAYGFTDLSALGSMTTLEGTISAEVNQMNHMKFHASRGEKIITIVLTIAHLDHTPENNKKDNLKALCQKCHNKYDMPHRIANRKRNKNDRT